MKPAPEELQARLGERFRSAMVSIVDDSHLHAGHKGAEGGAGHFTVNIVSDEFAGLGRLARHRLVYDAVAEWMPHRIHALVIKAATFAELADKPDMANQPDMAGNQSIGS
jgi:BolA protein